MRLDELTAQQVMRTPVLFAQAREGLRSVAARMHAEGVRCLIVLPERHGAAPGMITVKDVVQIVVQEGEEALDDVTVGEVMTSPAICVQAELPVLDCVKLMRMTGVRRVPVQRGGETIGILSTTDVFRLLMEE